MNKLFSKIAALSVGLAMAVGVGVAINAKGFSKAHAAEIPLLQFSRSGTTDSYTTGATFAKAAEAKSGYYQDGSNNPAYLQLKMDSALTIPSDATALTFKAVIGGGKAQSIEKPVMVELLGSDGSTIEDSSKVVTNEVTAQTGSEFSVDYTAFKSTSIYGVKVSHEKITGYNARYYSFNLSYTSASSTPTITLSKSELNVGVGTTDTVDVTLQDIEGDVTVTASSDNGGEVIVDSVISESKTLSIKGKTAGDVTLTFAAEGAESVTLSVNVAETTECTLFDQTTFTPGSRFILVGNDGKGKTGVLTPNLSSGIYSAGLVDIEGTSARTIYGNELSAEIGEAGVVVKEVATNKYVGLSALSDTGKVVTNADYKKIAYPYWEIRVDSENGTVGLVASTTDEGENRLLNYNPTYNRFTNYKVTQIVNTYIYASYLAPYVYISSPALEINSGTSTSVNFGFVNFGEETPTFDVSVEDESVASAVINSGSLQVTGAAAGETNITLTATSASYTASTTLAVKVNDATLVPVELRLSLLDDVLFKGQEFAYGGIAEVRYDGHTDFVDVDMSKVTYDGYDLSQTGKQIVTVSYTENEVTVNATYNLEVIEWDGVLHVGSYYVFLASYTKDEVTTNYAMTALGTNIGVASAYEDTLRSEFSVLVEAGNTYNSYAFKLSNGKYLSCPQSGTSNYLLAVDEVTDASSWTVTVVDGDYKVTNVGNTVRSIRFNYNSGNPRFSSYTSAQTAIEMVEVGASEVVSNFVANFMHPEIPFEDHSDTGACRDEGENKGYYSLASAAFNGMHKDMRDEFQELPEFADYKARLDAWAEANGYVINEDNLLVASRGSIGDDLSNNNSMIIIIAIASSSALAFSIALLLRKKKRQ